MELNEPADSLVGTVIGERYRVLAPLGAGGMGAVYRVEHTMMKKELALKLLHPQLQKLDEVARRFEREAEAAARLNHPNIIGVTDFGRTESGMLFLVMELLEGRSLNETIRPDGVHGQPLGLERALAIERQILAALEHAHASGIVHRDLKPDNIMLVEREGQPDVVKLLDFGIAKMTEAAGAPHEALTQAGMIFGTPEYLSPEQAVGQEADGRADLYAAGVILYEMLSGRRPFESTSRLEIISMHLTRTAAPVRQVAPAEHIPPHLERALERSMQKKREQRFASAGAFLAALDGRAEATPPFVMRHLRALGAGLAFVAALVGLLMLARRPVAHRPPAFDAAPLLEKLRTGRTCRERKAAALALIAADDPQYLDSLRAAAERRGGFLGLEHVNGCMGRELRDAIRRWQVQK